VALFGCARPRPGLPGGGDPGGQPADAGAVAAAARDAAGALAPESDLHATADYRRRVAQTLMVRASAWHRTGRGTARDPLIRVRVNDQEHERPVEVRRTRRDFLREDLTSRAPTWARAWRVRRLYVFLEASPSAPACCWPSRPTALA